MNHPSTLTPSRVTMRRRLLPPLLALLPLSGCAEVEAEDDFEADAQRCSSTAQGLLGFANAVVSDLVPFGSTAEAAGDVIMNHLGCGGSSPEPVDLSEGTLAKIRDIVGVEVNTAFLNEDIDDANNRIDGFVTEYIVTASNAEDKLNLLENDAFNASGQLRGHGLAAGDIYLANAALRMLIKQEWIRREQEADAPNQATIDGYRNAQRAIAGQVLADISEFNAELADMARNELRNDAPEVQYNNSSFCTQYYTFCKYVHERIFTFPGYTVSLECNETFDWIENWETECSIRVDDVVLETFSSDSDLETTEFHQLAAEFEENMKDEWGEHLFDQTDRSFLYGPETIGPWLKFAPSFEALEDNCKNVVNESACWNPIVSDPRLFSGSCACEGRIVRVREHAYQCLELPEACNSEGDPSYLDGPVPATSEVLDCGSPEGTVRRSPSTMRASNGNIVMPLAGGGERLQANLDNIGPWEAIERVEFDDGRVALRATNSCEFLQAVDAGGHEVRANVYHARGWEKYDETQLDNGNTVFQAYNGQYLGIAPEELNTLFADYWGPWDQLPPMAQFEMLESYEALTEACEFEKDNGGWSWACSVPAVSTPKLFTGDCACEGRVLKHLSTGRYRCERLPDTCGGVSFEATLGYPPNMNLYTVELEGPFGS